MHVYLSENEMAIEADVVEYRGVFEYIKRAKIGCIKVFSLSQNATAAPYEELAESLTLDCNGSKIKTSVIGKKVLIEYSEEYAEILASYFDFEKGTESGYHLHFDQYGNESFFDLSSLDAVIQVA